MKLVQWMTASVLVGTVMGPLAAQEAVSPEKGLGESVKPGINVKFLDPELKVDGFKENYFLRFRKE